MRDPSTQVFSASDALVRLVTQFATRHPHLADPDECRDLCIEASDAFVAECQLVGVRATTVTGAQFGEVPELPGIRLLMNGHTAALVTLDDTDVVYDWTARQFDPSAAFPAIVPLEDWRSTWTHPNDW